jgi:TolB-like protein/Tfp pilus assembly protein PilF
LATTISVWNAKAPGPHGNGVREAVRPPVRSVAVLPFENLSGESSSRVLSLGIAESVMHQLATQSQLMVIARSSSFAFEGRHADARDIGRQLNARYLLEGSVQAERGRLRVMTDLIDSETGADVWSMRFDRTPTDVFAMQDEIATAVARALELSVKAGAAFTPNTAQTQNMDAWMAYQQGRALAATRKLADLDLAGERFAEAARLDPQFALAYVARADTLAVRRMYSQSDSWLGMQPAFTSDAEKAEALEWLTHAIAVNPNEGTAYSVRAWLSDDPQKAEADYRRGLALNPNDAVGYERFAKLLYSFRTPDKMYVEPAKRDEAYEVVDHAIELDPLSPSPYITKALMLLYGRGNATEAESLLRRALELQPNYYPAVMRLAEARYFQGEIADAIHYAEQGLALEPSAVWARHYLLRMYLDLNDVEAATELADEGLARDTLLRVPIALFQHDWSKADHLAAADSDLGTPLDIEFCVWAWLQRVRLTHDYEPVRKRLAEWSGVRWDAQGVPSIPETNLDYADAMGLAEVLRWMGDNKRSDQLLHAIVRVLDHGSHDLKRGEQLFGPTRPEVLALLGDREGALTTLRNLSGGIGEGAWWYILDLEPAFDGLRDDPRFRSLRAQLNERAIQQRRRLDRMREDGSVRSRGKADRQGAQ